MSYINSLALILRFIKWLTADADQVLEIETRFDRSVDLIRQDFHELGESLVFGPGLLSNTV